MGEGFVLQVGEAPQLVVLRWMCVVLQPLWAPSETRCPGLPCSSGVNGVGTGLGYVLMGLRCRPIHS